MAVNLDDCRIGHGVFHVWFVTEHIEYQFENIRLNPSPETTEGAVPIPEFPRQVTPRRIRPRDPEYRHAYRLQSAPEMEHHRDTRAQSHATGDP